MTDVATYGGSWGMAWSVGAGAGMVGEAMDVEWLDREATERRVAVKEAAWRRRLRVRQARWREAASLPIGQHLPPRGAPYELGSRIAMPYAEEHLANYLTDTIRTLVRRELAEAHLEGKLYGTPRIFDDLLSSQPLCFNLFGELAEDLDLASEVLGHLWPADVDVVTAIRFEHSPGRGDERYLGTRTAFDVFVEVRRPDGRDGFIGIEVKYHEDLTGRPAAARPRVLEVAERSGVFHDPDAEDLRSNPLQQLWYDHLLALSMLQADDRWASGRFVLLHPAANVACYAASAAYERLLADQSTFQRLSLEEAVAVIGQHTEAHWIIAFDDRYLRDS